MKDCEKLIIVYYVNVAKYTPHNSVEVLAQVKSSLDGQFDETVKSIVVPIYESESHIEFCRPGESICQYTTIEDLDELI